MLMLLTAPLGLLPFPLFWAVWLLGSWLFFALSLRSLLPRGWALYAASFPAVFLDAMSGQIGCWIAAIFVWSLRLLPTRPGLAGALLGLAIVKPQLVWLAPLALCAARQWRSLAAFVGAALVTRRGAAAAVQRDRSLDYAFCGPGAGRSDGDASRYRRRGAAIAAGALDCWRQRGSHRCGSGF